MSPAWAPVVAVIIGVLASPLTTFVLEHLQYHRAKTDATYAFQRQTVTELQELVQRLQAYFGGIQIYYKIGATTERQWADPERIQRASDDTARLVVLSERVMDERLRQDIATFRTSLYTLMTSLAGRDFSFDKIAPESWEEFHRSFNQANGRMGFLIRETYQSTGHFGA